VIAAEAPDDAPEFIRRLTFSALIGNADMHLMNWSLIYPDRRTPQLSPAYDVWSTVVYLEDPHAALVGRSSRTSAI
jgi:serine/threonine-protein kinase HipA